MLDRSAVSVSRAISIRQPWAWAIVHAGKDCENRSLNAARAYRPAIGQRIFIHASARRPTKADIEWLNEYFQERDVALPPMSTLPFGGIVGGPSSLTLSPATAAAGSTVRWALSSPRPDLRHFVQ
jgi:hypothetical protein